MLMLSFITAIANKLLRYTMDDQPQQPPQPQERKKRIATQLIDSQEPQEVDFDHFGLHYGDKQIKFANECGVLTRSMISINYRTWKKVPQGELEMLWLTIKRHWNIQNNKRRDDVLKICNTAWKCYKKRLIRDFMANGRDPIPIYPYLDPDTWKTFKKERSSKEFQVISEKARANAKFQKKCSTVRSTWVSGQTSSMGTRDCIRRVVGRVSIRIVQRWKVKYREENGSLNLEKIRRQQC
ncbi:unnamed protein product [Lactuca virosa]|uniref:Uncharacterized protein n=1 Tax=Lactuca virosa TaxID=75947 RepID=A0AAU9LJ41_9ASTR|nr:unnamed protein product [Lactuca virosa]